MAGKRKRNQEENEDWALFEAEAAYADSMFQSALGNCEESIACLEHALEFMPTYAPAIMSLGSVDYQRGRMSEGRKKFLSLLDLPAETDMLCEAIDGAGSFLIRIKEYADGLELYRKAVSIFPDVTALYQGVLCCAGHEGLHEEAVQAAQRALELEPENQDCVNDLGWCLLERGDLTEAREFLERAVEMNPEDDLASENLSYCKTLIHEQSEETSKA
ncbi:MAG: tetratricopeptide repeat protein [bacterium]|nr:tetratricopeptide repeat protein [bacterium]